MLLVWPRVPWEREWWQWKFETLADRVVHVALQKFQEVLGRQLQTIGKPHNQEIMVNKCFALQHLYACVNCFKKLSDLSEADQQVTDKSGLTTALRW